MRGSAARSRYRLGFLISRTHAALYSSRGCSQVLLLGILSRHVYSITEVGRVRPGLMVVRLLRPAPCALSMSMGKIVAIVGNKMEIWISCKYFLYSLCTNDVPLSTRWRAFAWDRQADRGVKPLHDHIHTITRE